MTDELKECPFCKTKGNCRPTDFNQKMWMVHCNNADCLMQPFNDSFTTRAKAVKAWNRRTATDN